MTTAEAADRDARLRKLRMRSWRRGTKEMDMILGPYADACLAGLDPQAMDRYEALLAENDQDLYLWIAGTQGPEGDPPPEPLRPMIAAIAAHARDRLRPGG